MNERQPERTVLAWDRTVLAVVAVAALVVRLAEPGSERTVTAVLGALGVVLVGWTAHRRRRAVAHSAEPTAAAPIVFAGLGAGLAAVQAAALVIVV